MRLNVKHETHYRFTEPAKHSIQYLRLTPRQDPCQRVLSWSISAPGRLTPWIDGFENECHVAMLDEEHDELQVVVEGVVETIDTVGVLPGKDGLPPLIFARETPYTKAGAGVHELADGFRDRIEVDGPVATLHALTNEIENRVSYQSGITDVGSNAEQALSAGAGVCQDHAHVFIAASRVLGFPARYVSGYLLAGQGNDSHIASHAWAESHVDGLGWVSFDPTNRQSATDAYIRLAVGFDYASASPVRGLRIGGGAEEMSVKVTVEQQ